MYCVKCGVRLQEGIAQCPLCQTPVWNPDNQAAGDTSYSTRYPEAVKRNRYPVLGFLTALIVAVDLALLIFCLRTYHQVSWSGYVMLGSAVFYAICILPLWINKPHPLIFVPISFAAICGYLLYVCLSTGGHWFLSFAFPVTMIAGAITIGSVACFRYLKRGRLWIIGGLLITIGCSAMLVEMFQAITFRHPMFTWSLYIVSGFCAVGLFVLLCALIRPLREYLERKVFL